MTTQGSRTINADFHRLLVDQIPLPLITTDQHHNIQSINVAASELFHRQSDDIISKPISEIVPEEARQTLSAAINNALQESQNTEFIFNQPGNPNVLAMTIAPVTDDQNQPIAALVTIREVAQHIDPAASDDQRTKLASLGRMAGAFAHYFNNILGGAVTSVSYALSSEDPDLQAKTLKHTNEALARATKLIDSLLAFAEGDQRHIDRTDLAELIGHVASYIGPEMAEEGVTLDLKLEPIPKTLVSKTQFITVLENVLHNALDACEQNETVTIGTRLDDDTVTISVSDTGCGIHESQLARIFEPFFSTKSDVNADFEHHPGLGLAVAHGLLQVLGHGISVRSTPGQGTTVTIRLNAAKSPASSAE